MTDLSLMRFENQLNHRDIDTLQKEGYTQYLNQDLKVQIVGNK